MESEILITIQQICEEKDIPFETVIETVEQALAAAYRKDFGKKNQNIKVEFDPETGQTRVFDVKIVVEDLEETAEEGKRVRKKKDVNGMSDEAKRSLTQKKDVDDQKKNVNGVSDESANRRRSLTPKEEDSPSVALAKEEERKFNPRTEITLTEAKTIQKVKDLKVKILRSLKDNTSLNKEEYKEISGKIKIGDIIKTELEVPAAYGRMAAQSAKQVIIQKLREAEKEALYNKFKEKQGKVLIGVVQRREGSKVLVDLEKITAIIPSSEQIREESYNTGQRIRIYVLEVNQTSKGPEVILSRTHPEIVRELFFTEVPEISSGGVEIKAIAREAGSRTKIAVQATEKNIDPIGSCVGQRGSRVQIIISELGGEKIDIIQYDEDAAKFISQALSPAKVLSVDLNKKEKIAKVNVKEDQYSLAIGRGGQNVRLASQLTGWKIEINQIKEEKEEKNQKSGSRNQEGEEQKDM